MESIFASARSTSSFGHASHAIVAIVGVVLASRPPCVRPSCRLIGVFADDAHLPIAFQEALLHAANVLDALLAQLLEEVLLGDEFRAQVPIENLTVSNEQQRRRVQEPV